MDRLQDLVSRKGAKNAKKDSMNENELSKIALDVAFKIHKELGPGLFESVYELSWLMNLLRNII